MHEISEMSAQLDAINTEMESMETWRRTPSGRTARTTAAWSNEAEARVLDDDDAMADARMAAMGEPPEPTTGYDSDGWFVNDTGDRIGQCDWCGNEQGAGTTCCAQGTIVPTGPAY